MKNVFRGLRYFAMLALCISGGTFLVRWMQTGDFMLDQILIFCMGLVALGTAYFVRYRYKQEME